MNTRQLFHLSKLKAFSLFGAKRIFALFAYHLLVLALTLLVVFTSDYGKYGTDPGGQGVVRVVKTEQGYQLYRNGQAFKVTGAAGGNQLSALARAGGNTIRVYDPDALSRVLDVADSLGLAVIADIPLPAYSPYADSLYSGDEYLALAAKVRETVNKHKDHPALLFWMLGNEVFYGNASIRFQNAYESLVDSVHKFDPNHPVSTAIVAHELLSIYLSLERSPVDFISLNIFGNIKDFLLNKEPFSIVWNGPYLISEWSTNGHWESTNTPWQAPVEDPSLTRGRQLKDRYQKQISRLEDDGRCLGELVFFWGYKWEKTPSWFSFFDQAGNRSHRVLEMTRLWGGADTLFSPPSLEYLTINEQGAAAGAMVVAGQRTTAKATFTTLPADTSQYEWQLWPEDWYRIRRDLEPQALAPVIYAQSLLELSFRTPTTPGPYRLSLKVIGGKDTYAIANIPFYVLAATEDE